MSAAKPTGGKATKASASAASAAKTSAAKTTAAKTTTTRTTAKAKAAPKAAQPTGAAQPTENPAEKAGRRQQKLGRVVSNKMQKTIVVAVETHKRHRLYKRTYKATTKFKAHDEHNDALIGDMVRIEETRPLSKDKRWRLVEITQRAVQAPSVAQVVSQLDPETEGQ